MTPGLVGLTSRQLWPWLNVRSHIEFGCHSFSSDRHTSEAPPAAAGGTADFFVSYTDADRAWAECVGWQCLDRGWTYWPTT
jgi:hypothetical protein